MQRLAQASPQLCQTKPLSLPFRLPPIDARDPNNIEPSKTVKHCLGDVSIEWLDLVIMKAFKWRLKDGNWGKSFTIVSGAELMTSMYNT